MLFQCFIMHNDIKTYDGVEVHLHILSSAVVVGEWSSSHAANSIVQCLSLNDRKIIK